MNAIWITNKLLIFPTKYFQLDKINTFICKNYARVSDIQSLKDIQDGVCLDFVKILSATDYCTVSANECPDIFNFERLSLKKYGNN